MKKFIFFLTLFSFCLAPYAQNLEFSQVLMFSGTLVSENGTAQPPISSGPMHIVPQGKVWKIESVFSGAVNHLGFNINGVFCRINGGGGSSQMIFPIWLDEGDTVQAYVLPYAQGVGDYYISIIEFTAP
jgi:hypothetical protein